MKRTFIAVELPEKIKNEILKIQERLPNFEGKKIEFENLHLTLKFLGEIEEDKIEKIKEKLREIKFKSFESEIDSIGFFDKGERGIIWLYLTNCENLQKEIDDKLAKLFEREKRFMSHLTIARIKLIKNKKKFLEELNKIKISPLRFPVREFILKESILSERKPVYEDLGKYKLE